MQTIPSKKTSKIEFIEATRGISAIAVVMLHCTTYFSEIQYPFRGYFLRGAAGVDVFFVISGFVIFLAHSRDIGHPEALGRYAYNRFVRIFPLYWLVLTIWIALLALYRHGLPFSALIMIGSYTFTIQSPIIIAAWSLSYEVFFYAVFASAVRWGRFGRAMLAAFFASGIAALAFPTSTPDLAPLWSWRPLEFGGGALLWALTFGPWKMQPIPSRIVLAAAIVLLIALAIFSAPGYFYAVDFALFGLVFIRAEQRDFGLRIPASIVALGQATYALYIAHLPVLWSIAKPLDLIRSETSMLPIVGQWVIMVVVCVVAGLAIHRYVERPMLARFRDFRARHFDFSVDGLKIRRENDVR